MLHRILEQRLHQALVAVLPDAATANVLVRPCPDPKFGDYQTNSLMSLAKERKANPRQLATDVLAKLNVTDLCEAVEIAGAGFLNFRLKMSAIADCLEAANRGEHLFFSRSTEPRTVVIDFSSPNVAKPMHVGHIRSTILGDCLSRILRLLGHHVVTDNHIGDWGTQFGKLIVGWKNLLDQECLKVDAIAELEWIYKLVNLACEAEIELMSIAVNLLEGLNCGDQIVVTEWVRIQGMPVSEFEEAFGKESNKCHHYDFRSGVQESIKAVVQWMNASGFVVRSSRVIVAPEVFDRAIAGLKFAVGCNPSILERARQELVKLQDGDTENLRIWHQMIALSQEQFDTIYGRLGVKFDFTLGESFYNPRLKAVVHELRDLGIARESEGAICVFSDGKIPPKEDPFLKQEDGKWVDNPALIQKSDGAANYATTDLATVAYRMETWSPAEIVYVTDGRQQLHFRQIFATVRRWHPDAAVKLAHVWFGSINGEDGKPFKTRSGETIRLSDLLDEAELRAVNLVTENCLKKNVVIPEPDRREIGRIVGIGAVKYADLLPNRQSDYVFLWDKMIAFEGNTAGYIQYSFTRANKIVRDCGHSVAEIAAFKAVPKASGEIALARHLLNFGITLEAVAADYRPNFLCNYLYDLAGLYAGFYENCPVLKPDVSTEDRATRILLCSLTARVLKQGLEVLGVETSERM